MVSFDISKEDDVLIQAIADRVESKQSVDRLSLVMDLTVVHCNGNPLRLKDMLEGRDSDLFHDIYGILVHLDRKTGKLKNHFSPRFSV